MSTEVDVRRQKVKIKANCSVFVLNLRGIEHGSLLSVKCAETRFSSGCI